MPHLSLLYSDEIILSGAFRATAAVSMILYMKSDLVKLGSDGAEPHVSPRVFTHLLLLPCCVGWIYKKHKVSQDPINHILFNNITFSSSEYNQYKIHNDKIYFK